MLEPATGSIDNHSSKRGQIKVRFQLDTDNTIQLLSYQAIQAQEIQSSLQKAPSMFADRCLLLQRFFHILEHKRGVPAGYCYRHRRLNTVHEVI